MALTRVLLDTSAYSAFMRGDEAVVRALREAEAIGINAIILGEMLAGFRRGQHRSRNEADLRRFLSSPRVTILEIDDETAERYATILESLWRAGTPIATNDLWIAASAMQYGLRLLTLDRDFTKVPQILVELYERDG